MDCKECERLWSACVKRILQQADLLSQYYDAVKARELEKIAELEGALAVADGFRNASRETLMGHRAVEHCNRFSAA